jgi:hypothetical protein
MKSVGKDLIFIKIQLPSSFTILLINSIVLYIFLYIFPIFFILHQLTYFSLLKKFFYKNFV